VTDTEREPSRADGFYHWWMADGAGSTVLTLASGFGIEWFFGTEDGFSPLLFILGALAPHGAIHLYDEVKAGLGRTRKQADE